MTTRNSALILAKDINVDRSYNNVLNYTEQQMLSLVQSKQVYSQSNFSFIRQGENRIKVDTSYGNALKANYIAFQNPNYSNKWFFAWITDVKYISDDCTEIDFEIDEFSTWWDYWDPAQCFVIREHTNSDIAGNNTQPENFELGEYVLNGNVVNNTLIPQDSEHPEQENNSQWICFQVSDYPDGAGALNPSLGDDVNGERYSGVYSGLSYLFVLLKEHANRLIKCYDKANKSNAIVAIFQVPLGALSDVQIFNYTDPDGNLITIGTLGSGNDPIQMLGTTITKPSTLDSYSPVNQKLKTYPYQYFYVTNNSGSDVIYHYEDFNGNPNFAVRSVVCQGMSTRAYPTNYKRGTNKDGYNFGINGGKLPICAWNSDYYTNWCTQNAVNMPLSIAGTVSGGLLGMASSAMAGSALGMASSALHGVVGVAQSFAKQYEASMTPDQARGNVNSGDINVAMTRFGFTFYPMSIKSEYAQRIDQYFSRYGYKTNLLKTPNQTGRRYWNYVQIADNEDIVKSNNQTISVPAKSADTINNIYRKGVTIWHDHANIGNYSLSNTIV